MNIFVTGATGVLGKVVVKRLVADGHHVSALSRSEVNRQVLQGFGAEPTTEQFLRFARWGIAAYPGPHDAYLPQIWVEDAAGALTAALTPSVPSGVYDIVDDEPLTRGEAFADDDRRHL